MKRTLIFAVVFILFFGLITQNSYADINIGLTVGDEGIEEFHLSICSHYGVQEDNVVKIRKRSIPDDELVVVFFLAKHASVAPMIIVDLRLKGKSWFDISAKFGLSTEIYYVQFDRDPGPPYGNAYGHFKNKPKKHWHKINFDDDDIINIVNLKFLTTRYKCSPEDVIKLRKQKISFANINANLKKSKEQKKMVSKSANKKQSGNKGKNKKSKSKNK
jgi:hypothetical protein